VDLDQPVRATRLSYWNWINWANWTNRTEQRALLCTGLLLEAGSEVVTKIMWHDC
jgi:hypothetical protein